MTPGAVYSKKDLPSNPKEVTYMKCVPYCQAVGSLMYTAVATHPDITFTVSILSWFLENPGNIHWEAVKCIFRYLKGTKNFQLTYGNEWHNLEGFIDANGNMQENQHVISSNVFLINGGAISWSSKKQELVTLLTAKSEYVVATHTSKKAKWLHKLLGKLFPHLLNLLTTLYCDNQSAIKLAITDNYHSYTWHLD
jgi:hypothetical protein